MFRDSLKDCSQHWRTRFSIFSFCIGEKDGKFVYHWGFYQWRYADRFGLTVEYRPFNAPEGFKPYSWEYSDTFV